MSGAFPQPSARPDAMKQRGNQPHRPVRSRFISSLLLLSHCQLALALALALALPPPRAALRRSAGALASIYMPHGPPPHTLQLSDNSNAAHRTTASPLLRPLASVSFLFSSLLSRAEPLCSSPLPIAHTIFGSHGGSRQHARHRSHPAPQVARPRGLLLGHAGRRPLQPWRAAGHRRRVRALRLLQARQPWSGRGHDGAARVGGRQVLLAAAGRQGPLRPGLPVRLRQQAHRAQWRHGVARVPAPRRRVRVALRRLRRPVLRGLPGGAERVHRRGAEGGGAGDGGDGGGAGHCGRGRAELDGDGGGERPGVPGEPLPAVPRAAGARLQRHRLRRAHRPAAHLRAALQRHVRPADRAPERAVGVRAFGPRRLLRQRRRFLAGADQREVQEREAQGGGQQPEV